MEMTCTHTHILTICLDNSTDLKGHTTAIEKVAFNPVKDAELVSVSGDGVVKFWDVRTKNARHEITGLGDAFTLAWAPDGETLVVGNKVRSFDLVGYVHSGVKSFSCVRNVKLTCTRLITFMCCHLHKAPP